MLKNLIYSEDAQSMTEYILIVALVAVICVVAIKLFGKQVLEMIQKSTDKIQKETKGFDK